MVEAYNHASQGTFLVAIRPVLSPSGTFHNNLRPDRTVECQWKVKSTTIASSKTVVVQ